MSHNTRLLLTIIVYYTCRAEVHCTTYYLFLKPKELNNFTIILKTNEGKNK